MEAIKFASMPPKIDYGKEELLLVTVTPEVASFFMVRNYEGQRKLNDKIVSSYARDMASGRWKTMINDPITFDVKGHMTNGQHRVKAVIEAQTPIDMYVLTGQPEENFQFYDNGRTRLTRDFVQLPDRNKIVTVAQKMYIIDAGLGLRRAATGTGGEKRPTRSELLEYIGTYEQNITSLKLLSERAKDGLGKVPAGQIATWLYIGAIIYSQASMREIAESIISPTEKVHYAFRDAVKDKFMTTQKPTAETILGMLSRYSDAFRADDFPSMYTRYSSSVDKWERLLAEAREERFEINPANIWKA